MNMLEKFKDKQLDAQSMKQVKGGHDVGSWHSCVDETGHYRDVYVGYGQDLFEEIDKINEDVHQNAIVGCEAPY